MYIGHMDHFAFEQSTSSNGSTFWLDRYVPYVIHEL